jgi:hypothetical protein
MTRYVIICRWRRRPPRYYAGHWTLTPSPLGAWIFGTRQAAERRLAELHEVGEVFGYDRHLLRVATVEEYYA